MNEKLRKTVKEAGHDEFDASSVEWSVMTVKEQSEFGDMGRVRVAAREMQPRLIASCRGYRPCPYLAPESIEVKS